MERKLSGEIKKTLDLFTGVGMRRSPIWKNENTFKRLGTSGILNNSAS